ncbi:MAG: hypothetical protein ACK4Y5_13250 [Acetobacteraceae bacterium]
MSEQINDVRFGSPKKQDSQGEQQPGPNGATLARRNSNLNDRTLPEKPQPKSKRIFLRAVHRRKPSNVGGGSSAAEPQEQAVEMMSAASAAPMGSAASAAPMVSPASAAPRPTAPVPRPSARNAKDVSPSKVKPLKNRKRKASEISDSENDVGPQYSHPDPESDLSNSSLGSEEMPAEGTDRQNPLIVVLSLSRSTSSVHAHGENGQVNYRAAQLIVDKLEMSKKDRPPTRFGKNQESHTVPWSLKREAQVALSGQNVEEVLENYKNRLTQLEKFGNAESAQPLLKKIKHVEDGELPIHEYPVLLSHIIKGYNEIYQSSSFAVRKAGPPKGQGEGFALDAFRNAERYISKTNQKLDWETLKELQDKVEKLLDVDFRHSFGEQNYVAAVEEWIHSLSTAFPRVMKDYGKVILDPWLKEKINAVSVRKSGVNTRKELLIKHKIVAANGNWFSGPASEKEVHKSSKLTHHVEGLRTDENSPFLASIFVAPIERGINEITHDQTQIYFPASVMITKLEVSDHDRPATQFRSQGSHTIAWSLIRRSLMGMKNHTANKFLEIISDLLDVLEVSEKGDEKSLKSINKIKSAIRTYSEDRYPINQWPTILSSIVRAYANSYQQTKVAVVINEATLGVSHSRGEAQHLKILSSANEALLSAAERPQQFQPKTGIELRPLVNAAMGLLDLKPLVDAKNNKSRNNDHLTAAGDLFHIKFALAFQHIYAAPGFSDLLRDAISREIGVSLKDKSLSSSETSRQESEERKEPEVDYRSNVGRRSESSADSHMDRLKGLVGGESGVDAEIEKSVIEFIAESNYMPGGHVLVVSGENWDCYIRCVLHHFNKIDALDDVRKEIKKANINIGSGVTIGTDTEEKIISIIENVYGVAPFHVKAIDLNQINDLNQNNYMIDYSKNHHGQEVTLLLTGAHFSLVQPKV